MKTGDLTEVADVLKNLRLVSEKKSLSFREKKMFERAKYFIVSEVAQVKALDDMEAEKLIEDSLEASLDKLKKAKEKTAKDAPAEDGATVETEAATAS